ncbi:hypothetical protein H310_07428 [Aphanomyces invadans]|uniref:Uncharacterized protein n=1 Tax=Aphanomyces invadans TaxID=157072 RepID=A0A024U311_9STRA|nr:hypothetical protein H310_07428 [Aphanomyces invadans]ETV99977.1 hypothetical protein H310_07428 [Aphanomyces invadans]|eukprot:XP_008871395.1 hypothetical protein H310_07428 [Aphanomyces invadans]
MRRSSGSTFRLSDKAFLTFFIPLACILFASAPALVLQSFADPLYETSEAVPDVVRHKVLSWWNKQTWPRLFFQQADAEIPLVFLHEQYPTTGRKTLRLHDKKYLKMAETMQQSKRPSELGYVYIFNAKDARDLPKGELVQVDGFEWRDDGCLVSTTRKRSFRIKSIRRDPHHGIMFAKVEWI